MTEECNAVGNDIVSALLALCYCCHHILTFTQINGCDTYSAVMGWGWGVGSVVTINMTVHLSGLQSAVNRI